MCTARHENTEDRLDCEEGISEDLKECKMKAAEYAEMHRQCKAFQRESNKECDKGEKEDRIGCRYIGIKEFQKCMSS